jgi:uncharacterized membrane protein YcaP (DUF421 family)
MESVVRAVIIYFLLLVVFRVAGKRTLAQMTAFDVVLLLIIGESTQQALLGEDFSLVNCMLVIATFVVLDMLLAQVKQSLPRVERVLDEPPLVVVENGRPLFDRMVKERIDEADILHAARASHGLEHMAQIKYAVLEASGGISIIPAAKEELPGGPG